MFRSTLLVFVFILALQCRGDELFSGAPSAPAGYDDYKKAQAAVIMGKVKRVEFNTEVPETVTFHDDVEFAVRDGVSLTLDLYVPKNAKTPPPVVVFIHGGAWRSGKKEDAAPYAIPFAEKGYATASIQYRLVPNTWPKAIQDVNSAIYWLRKRGQEYRFDGSRIALSGGSAGGHLALLAGYAQDPALGSPDNAAHVNNRVDAIINLYGVTDLTTAVAQSEGRVHAFMGERYPAAVDQYALASPILHLDKDDPPTITFHGTIDELVPIAQADRLHEKLDNLGITNYYDRIDGWPHSMDMALPIYERCFYVVDKFLFKHLPIKE
jgi:acetyl esterase/lipase